MGMEFDQTIDFAVYLKEDEKDNNNNHNHNNDEFEQ